jgi:hypothetical protein
MVYVCGGLPLQILERPLDIRAGLEDSREGHGGVAIGFNPNGERRRLVRNGRRPEHNLANRHIAKQRVQA